MVGAETRESVLVLMSGGVDSAVACLNLLEQGCHVEALFLRLLDDASVESSYETAAALARDMDIRFHEIDISNRFETEIIKYFVDSYSSGLTPNPCVKCNPLIKIRTGLEIMRSLGLSKLATGHYARVENSPGGVRLLRGLDSTKDQSYFLHRLERGSLSSLILPLGSMSKTEVFERAHDVGISSEVQPESQDICFLQGDYRAFLKKKGVDFGGPGMMVDISGREVGRHVGLENYTVGQRRGLGVTGPEPKYVIRLDTHQNRLVVGPETALYGTHVSLRDVNWLVRPEEISAVKAGKGHLRFNCDVKIRYRHRPAAATVEVLDGCVKVFFEEPQRAITPGQFAVFYRDDIVIGGGEICA